MTYEITGKVKLLQEPQTFASGFTKRELILTLEDGKYPQEICIEFHKDRISLLDGVSEGQQIKVFFDLRGREYNGRYFNNLVGWKIESNDEAGESPSKGAVKSQAAPPEPEPNGNSVLDYPSEWDDLEPPF